ncbi:hypothetical protein HDU96_007160 [Phlyctochytrium bullatum]|nr:hypothetical protein HDU96_007160 [Phlyctochytrium bullatum]
MGNKSTSATSSPTSSRSRSSSPSSPSPPASPTRTATSSSSGWGLLAGYVVFELARRVLSEATATWSLSSLPGDAWPLLHSVLTALLTDSAKLILALLAVLITSRNFSLTHLRSFLFPSTLIFINHCISLFFAFNYTPTATINYLLNLQLPLTAILHHFILRKQSSWGFTAVFIAYLGVVLTHLTSDLDIDSAWPILLTTLMAINASIVTIVTERLLRTLDMPFWDQLLRMNALCTLSTGLLAFVVSRRIKLVDQDADGPGVLPATIGTIVAGAFSGIAATAIIYRLNSVVTALTQGMVSVLAPLALFLAFGVFRSSPDVFVLGAALLLVATYAYASARRPNPAGYAPLDTGLDARTTPHKPTTLTWKSTALLLVAVFGVQQALLVFHASSATPRPAFRCSVDPLEYYERLKAEDGLSVVRDIEDECALATPRELAKCTVPKVLHLVVIGGYFKMHHYLAIRSMNDKIRPEKFYIHGSDFPLGQELFERVMREFKPVLITSRNVSTIYTHIIGGYEHRSDVLRLENVIRFGGMYFDLDVFAVKDMDRFLGNEATMGAQPGRGINNGMIIGKRCARFLRHWHRQYRSFNDSLWDEHSVHLPGILYDRNPRGLVLASEALYNHWPNQICFNEEHDPKIWKPIHAVHSFYRDYGKEHSEEELKTLENNYGRLARNLMFGGPALDDFIPPVSNRTGGEGGKDGEDEEDEEA